MPVALSQPPSQDHDLFYSRDLRPPNFAAYHPAKEIKGGHRAGVRCLGWNTDARRLASAGVDKVVRVWTPERSVDVRTSIELRGHTETVEALSWDPTHPERLATASTDRTVRLWDIRSGTAAVTTTTPGANINLSFHPKGHLIAVGNREDVLSLIDVRAGGKILGTIQASPATSKEEINEVSWNHSGSIFIATTGTGYVRILDSRPHNDVDPPKIASESASAQASAGLKANGEAAAATATATATTTAPANPAPTSTNTAPTETKADAKPDPPVGSAAAAMQSLDTKIPWRPVHTLVAHTATIFCAQFDPMGRYIATAGADATVACWSLPEMHSVWMSGSDLNYPPRSLSFSHDGEFLAAGGEDPHIWIGSTVDGSTVHKLPVSGTINALSWSPARHLLAYAGEEKVGQEGTIRIWGL